MKTKWNFRPHAGLALAAAAALAACGGGGGGDGTGEQPAATTAEGAYEGTLTGSASNAFQLLVLENGEYWVLYGTNAGDTLHVAGFIQGSGTSSNGKFTSTNARLHDDAWPVAGSVSATYNAAAHTISGTVSPTSRLPVGFNGGAIASSTYNYNTAATLATVSGNWTLTDLNGVPLTLSIGSTGAFTGNWGDCALSGTVTPRASGKNVYNVTLTFGWEPCNPGETLSGIAVASPLADGRTQLRVAAVDGTRTSGAVVSGTR